MNLIFLMAVAPILGAVQLPPPTIDGLIDKVLDLRKQIAELEKQEATTLTQLQALLADQKKRLDELNVKPPVPPDPPLPDAVAAALRSAYAKDVEAKNGTKGELADLTSLWRMAGQMVLQKGSTTYKVDSSADLMAAIREAAVTMKLSPTTFRNLRTQIGVEVASALGEESDTQYTDAQRVKAAAFLTKISEVLSGLDK